MKLSSSDVLDAYRADLGNANRSQLSEWDATWLAFGTMLERAVRLPAGERLAYLRTGAAVLAEGLAPTPVTREIAGLATGLASEARALPALCSAVMAVAGDAENAGAFALATIMLDYAKIIAGGAEVRLQGRLMWQQARIFRKIGELDLAVSLFDDVGALGEKHGDRELVALAHLGKGIVARIRGNYPLARTEFLATLEAAPESEDTEQVRLHAHHGLLVVSAIAKDFDAALRHGSLALAATRSDAQRVELLANLASVCYDVGQFRSALHGHLHVLGESRSHRVRLGAFGGAAVAAARLGNRAMVHRLASAAAALAVPGGLEHEVADMHREFAEAYAYLGETELSARHHQDALARAQRGGYFEIIHRLESFVPEPKAAPPRPVALTDDALTVARQLAEGDSEELLLAAVSSAPQD